MLKVDKTNKDWQNGLSSFLQELKVHVLLRSEKIVLLYGISFDQNLCLITPFQSGGSLYEAIHVKRIFAQQEENQKMQMKLNLLIQLSEGILCLHTNEPAIIHRDITSKNVLLDQNNSVKICDLGLARLLKESKSKATVTNSSIGNASYMAPECFDHEKRIGPEVDI